MNLTLLTGRRIAESRLATLQEERIPVSRTAEARATEAEKGRDELESLWFEESRRAEKLEQEVWTKIKVRVWEGEKV